MSKNLETFLTPLDAAFLYFESPKQAMHIGSCMIYEGDMSKQRLVALLEERLHLAPRYRQRAVFPPLWVSHPLWLDDPDFDPAGNVDEVRLPEELDREVFSRFVAEAYQGMLPRDRPLWKAIILRGLPGPHTAIVWKVHHAMIDGVSGIDLTMALNDLKPDHEVAPPKEPWQPEALPERLDLFQRGLQHRLDRVTRLWTESAFSLLRPGGLRERLQTVARAARVTLPTTLTPAPKTPFNGSLSGEMGWAWAELSFTEMRQVRSALGGTVNDLVLATLSGAVGRYLRHHGVKTDHLTLRAMCPVSMRQETERGQLGNLVSFMVAPLLVGIVDPLDRLEATRVAMEELKNEGQAEGFHEMNRWSDGVPPALMALLGLLPPVNPVFNTVSTNVPGPQIPIYQAGHRLAAWYPLGVVAARQGLFVSILTYDQRLTFGATVDRHLLPDPWLLADFLHESYDELRERAGVKPIELARVPVERAEKKRKRSA